MCGYWLLCSTNFKVYQMKRAKVELNEALVWHLRPLGAAPYMAPSGSNFEIPSTVGERCDTLARSLIGVATRSNRC